MRSMRFALLAGALLLVPGWARADNEADRGQARELGQKAYEAAQAGDWAKAEDLFHRADAIFHAPTLLLGLARARAHLGKFVEAWEDYHRVIIEPVPANAAPALLKAVDDAKAEIGSVEGKRAHATISVTGSPSPTVTLDGASISSAALGTERLVNPGTHAVHVEAPGCAPADTTFTVTPGGSATATVALKPADAAAPPPAAVTPAPAPAPAPATQSPPPASADSSGDGGSTRRLLGIIGLGVGGAGIATGAVTGILAMSQHNSLKTNACATSSCSQGDLSSYKSSVSSYQTMGTVSTVSFIAGGVLAAAGAVIFFTAPSAEGATQGAWIRPYVGAGSLGAVGAF